jgi:hypothetical protein
MWGGIEYVALKRPKGDLMTRFYLVPTLVPTLITQVNSVDGVFWDVTQCSLLET